MKALLLSIGMAAGLASAPAVGSDARAASSHELARRPRPAAMSGAASCPRASRLAAIAVPDR